jgi:two-component system, LuxR family, sensor kinase FixL
MCFAPRIGIWLKTGCTNLNRVRTFAACASCALFFFFSVPRLQGAELAPTKRVLIISTGSRLAPGFIIVDQQLLQVLGNIPSLRIETYAENLDLVRFPTERYSEIFSEYLTAKYAANPPDLVILVYVGNLGVPGKLLPQVFPGVPIVVAGLSEEELRPHQFGDFVTGVAQRVDPGATLELILRLQPGTRRIVVIGGTAEIDRHVLERVRKTAESFKDRVEIDFWDDRTMAELRAGVATLSSDTVILFARLFRDGAGQAFISSEVGQWIARSASAPVYIMVDSIFGTGAVGGSLASVEAFGKRAGELARLILTGTPPGSLPFEIGADSVPTFDWRALKRWDISESRLPPNSVVRFRPQSLWQQYRWYVIAALVIICAQGAIIIELLIERARRRRIQADLKENQQLMELATSASELGLWSRDLKTGYIWANAAMRSLFGFGTHEPLRFDDMIARVHPHDRSRLIPDVTRAEDRELAFEGEVRVVLPDGTERWLLAKGRTVVGPNSEERRRMGAVLDISERKRNAEALERERAFLRQVIDIDPNFIFAKDRDGRFTLANQALAAAYGTTVDNLIGKTDADFDPNMEEVQSFQRADREVLDTLRERFIAEERLTDAQGRARWLQTVKRPILDKDGIARQVLCACTDITRRKETEMELQEQRAELAHVARVSTMGELAASLAHELNQPLTAILSNAQAALRFMNSSPANMAEVNEILHDIIQDNNRAGEVIRRMRALAKKENLELATLDVASLIRDVVLLVHSDAILHNVRVLLQLVDGLPPVKGDRVQLQQVVLNIILNAFDAMKECPTSERTVILRAKSEGSEVIKVAVSDFGTGLSSDKLDKIFQPFYTSKRDGLGMGLSICRSIIAAHGGKLWAENNEGRGATFYFTLPVLGGSKDT